MKIPELMEDEGIDMIEDHVESGGKQFNSQDLLTICMWIGLALGIGTIVSAGLSVLTPLPAYIWRYDCAAVIRNFGDFTKAYKINDAALDAVSNVALSLFVTMAINSLKLVQLIDLALPLITILVVQWHLSVYLHTLFTSSLVATTMQLCLVPELSVSDWVLHQTH